VIVGHNRGDVSARAEETRLELVSGDEREGGRERERTGGAREEMDESETGHG
jgi:hypothetical protein